MGRTDLRWLTEIRQLDGGNEWIAVTRVRDGEKWAAARVSSGSQEFVRQAASLGYLVAAEYAARRRGAERSALPGATAANFAALGGRLVGAENEG